jgi:hypothetical protein
MRDLHAYARQAAARAGCDPDLFERQIQQESAFDPEAYNASSGATGIAQIVTRFHPDVDPHDPIASLDYAARWMARLRDQLGSYRKALAAYNWGPGNVSRWDGSREDLPAETRHYLDVILGPGWPEPSGASAGGSDGSNGQPGDSRADGGEVASMLGLRVARVDPDRLNLRARPGRSAAVIDRLAEGTILEPLGPALVVDDLTWLLAREPGGSEGWAATSFLDLIAVPRRREPTAPDSPPEPPHREPDKGGARFTVTTDGVRLRERPGTGADVPVLSLLHGGEIVDDDGDESAMADGFSWRRVRSDGHVGWIAEPFISPLATGRRHFDATTPTELQVQDWTCSIRSTMWLLKSIGVGVTPADAQDAMSPAYVSSEVGLLDASGAGIVQVLRDVWGVTAYNRAPASFDEVTGWAGRCPVALGGRNWSHWTAVRGTRTNEAGETVLALANPGGTGPRFGQQTLNRQQFADLGWFSAVVVPVD